MTASSNTRLRRSVRAFTLGSGPLKRTSDRVQMIARFVVLLAFLAAPPVAVAAATSTTAHLESVASREAAERTRAVAVLLEDAAAPARTAPNVYSTPLVSARAAWRAPDGTAREGVVFVVTGSRAGTGVSVWVDRDGRLMGPPLDRGTIPASALVMAGFALVWLPLVGWILYALLAAFLGARRKRQWTRGWAAVEREWGTRLL